MVKITVLVRSHKDVVTRTLSSVLQEHDNEWLYFSAKTLGQLLALVLKELALALILLQQCWFCFSRCRFPRSDLCHESGVSKGKRMYEFIQSVLLKLRTKKTIPKSAFASWQARVWWQLAGHVLSSWLWVIHPNCSERYDWMCPANKLAMFKTLGSDSAWMMLLMVLIEAVLKQDFFVLFWHCLPPS